ncbi:MAG TPA: DUF1800 domain-containing protein [Verrucomicrobiae bacterium]|nr:DUF1800 domain-containing protein [Verrucomicrobiae bacterium]
MLKPIENSKWDFSTAAHLLNRAGFGGTPEDIERLAALTPEQAVLSLINYEQIPDTTANPDWAKPDPGRPERIAALRNADPATRKTMQEEQRRIERQRSVELKHWWLERMTNGPRPLQEKMTLFWHGHFATSEQKVRDAYLMWKQNDLFRQHATGNWLQLLTVVAKDPAMLVWLDQAQSRKEHPNENFAREVMELFTLGEGHYTEKDVTEGARALTGWGYDIRDEEFVDRPRFRDDGIKTFLGRTGDLTGDDVLEQIVAQPQAARFISAKLWNFFAGEPPSDALLTALADYFRRTGMNFKPLLAAMFYSEEFYSDSIVRNQVKSPVQWLVGSSRVLQRDVPAPFICYGLTRSLGQDLFAPPNVKGWDGGLSWINTANLLARYNYAAFLVEGDVSVLRGMSMGPRNGTGGMQQQNRLNNLHARTVDVSKILTPEERSDKAKLLAALERRLIQGKLRGEQEKTLRDYLDGQPTLDNDVILNTIRLMMSTPEYQLA